MISRALLRTLAAETLIDAEVLLQQQRWKGAYYLCGYVVELALKERIYRSLDWDGYPETNSEFQAFTSFRTHDLDTLLRLSGMENKIRMEFLGPWSGVRDWNPQLRYVAPDADSAERAKQMLTRTKVILEALWSGKR